MSNQEAATNPVVEGMPPSQDQASLAPPQPQAQSTDNPPGILGGDGEAKPADKPVDKLADKPADTVGDTTSDTQEELKIEFPEGANPELVEAFKSVAKEIALDSAKAQKIVDAYLQAEKKVADALQAEWLETHRRWEKEIRDDPEFGGSRFERNVNLANRALEQFGGQELIDFLREARLTNCPPLVRAFMRIGQALAPDSIAGSHGAPNSPDASKDPFDAWLEKTMPNNNVKEGPF